MLVDNPINLIILMVILIVIFIYYFYPNLQVIYPNICYDNWLNYSNLIPNLKFYYINLQKRRDRKYHILNQLNKIGINKNDITRINAVPKKNGHFGCALSHLKTLEKIYQDGVEYGVVLEDDFTWKFSSEITLKVLNQVMKDKDWQVCLLACNGKTERKSRYCSSVISCQTTSGYIIHRNYIPILKKHWQWYIDNKIISDKRDKRLLLENEKGSAIDQSWKILQRRDRDKWIITKPILGKQIESYSDIAERKVDHGV